MASTLLGGSAQAASDISGLYNTGVDLGASDVDQAWQIVGGYSNPRFNSYPTAVYADATNGVFPIGPWVQNTNVSAWDTPTNPLTQNLDPTYPGTYVYQTTFTVAGPVSSLGHLTGVFAADNEVSQITLNGVTIYTGPSSASQTSQFASFTAFSDFGNFVTGTNTLQFTVVNFAQNGGNPSGLNVQFGPATAVPEMSTWLMMLAGFAGLGFAGHRRKAASAASHA